MVVRKIVIPKRYLKRAKQKGTVVLRDRETGQLEGRRAVNSGQGDSTKSQYLTVSRDFNKDGKISSGETAGTIHGRSIVKGDSKKRGTIRRF